MVAALTQNNQRLSTQTATIADGTTALRSLDWDRDRFDIEFGLQNGTTYNSFVVQGDQTALIDTSHEKFGSLYLDALKATIDPSQIDYLIVSHTEPDHSGLVEVVLELAPQAVVVGSKVGLQFLDGFVHRPFERQTVKSGDRLDLGQGHVLEFVNAPNLHWPDTMLTYDWKTQVLFTCDVFGMHYCSESLYDRDLQAIEGDYRFYYDCLMAPNAHSVLTALKRINKLGELDVVANGHGPLLYHHAPELIRRYRDWSQAQTNSESAAAVFYVSNYGDSDRLSQAVAHGITKAGSAVEMVDMSVTDPQEIREVVEASGCVAIGMPPSSGTRSQEAATALATILASVSPKQGFGAFESHGGDDEPIDPLATQLRDLGLKEVFAGIRLTAPPDEATLKLCEEAGTDVGQWLNRERSVKQMKSLDSELDKAMGRLSGGLYIITAQQGEVKSAMLASWVAQASAKPLGISIAVAKDRAIESLLQTGDRFVLNVLAEGNYRHLMKHFLKRFPPGADRFEGVDTQAATNGAPILSEALAYLECEVIDRMACSDHWILYCQVEAGRVSHAEGRTAVHHRKVGNHY